MIIKGGKIVNKLLPNHARDRGLFRFVGTLDARDRATSPDQSVWGGRSNGQTPTRVASRFSAAMMNGPDVVLAPRRMIGSLGPLSPSPSPPLSAGRCPKDLPLRFFLDVPFRGPGL